MFKKLMHKLFSEKGQSLVETALIIALVSIVAIGALTATGTSVNSLFGNIVEQLGGEADSGPAEPLVKFDGLDVLDVTIKPYGEMQVSITFNSPKHDASNKRIYSPVKSLEDIPSLEPNIPVNLDAGALKNRSLIINEQNHPDTGEKNFCKVTNAKDTDQYLLIVEVKDWVYPNGTPVAYTVLPIGELGDIPHQPQTAVTLRDGMIAYDENFKDTGRLADAKYLLALSNWNKIPVSPPDGFTRVTDSMLHINTDSKTIDYNAIDEGLRNLLETYAHRAGTAQSSRYYWTTYSNNDNVLYVDLRINQAGLDDAIFSETQKTSNTNAITIYVRQN